MPKVTCWLGSTRRPRPPVGEPTWLRSPMGSHALGNVPQENRESRCSWVASMAAVPTGPVLRGLCRPCFWGQECEPGARTPPLSPVLTASCCPGWGRRTVLSQGPVGGVRGGAATGPHCSDSTLPAFLDSRTQGRTAGVGSGGRSASHVHLEGAAVTWGRGPHFQ